MTHNRAVFTFILILAVAAGIIIGYAAFGLRDVSPITTGQSVDTRPLLEAIATSLAPHDEPTPAIDPTAEFIETLPACGDPAVPIGQLCVPVYTHVMECRNNEDVYIRALAIPCMKRDEH